MLYEVITTAPVLTTSAISSTFSYVFGYGPSTESTFTVRGKYLTGSIIVTPPTDYEISTTSGSGFVSTSLTLTQISDSVPTTTIYARLKSGLGVGTYAENAVVSTTNATSKNIALSGTITASATIV